MRLFGSIMSVAVAAGAGLAYYVYQRHERTGEGYVDVIKQLPGEVQRMSEDMRRRAAEAIEKGKAAARRREDELVRQLEAATSPAGAPETKPGGPAQTPEPPPPATEAAPAAGPEPSAA